MSPLFVLLQSPLFSAAFPPGRKKETHEQARQICGHLYPSAPPHNRTASAHPRLLTAQTHTHTHYETTQNGALNSSGRVIVQNRSGDGRQKRRRKKEGKKEVLSALSPCPEFRTSAGRSFLLLLLLPSPHTQTHNNNKAHGTITNKWDLAYSVRLCSHS